MSDIFEYVPHPHAEERKVTGPPTVAAAVAQLHGPGPIGRLNAKIGLKVTVIVGTMWCAYLFTLLALISAPSAFKTGNSLIIIAWIAQTFLQLVLCGPDVIIGMAAGVVGCVSGWSPTRKRSSRRFASLPMYSAPLACTWRRSVTPTSA